MKISDNFTNSEITLREALNLYKSVQIVNENLLPFSEMKKKNPKLTPPLYMQQLSKVLRDFKINNFAIMYPNLGLHFINADALDVAAKKLSASLISLSNFYEEISKIFFIVKSDRQCKELRLIIKNVIRNILLFIESQYKLKDYPTIEYLPLFNFCETENISIEEFVSWFNAQKNLYEVEFYIYEIDNQISSRFLEDYPELYELAADLQFPLTLTTAYNVLEGNVASSTIYKEIESYSKTVAVSTEDCTMPSTLKILNLCKV